MLTLQAGTRRRVALLLRALGAAVVIGAVVGGANGSGFRDAPLLGAMLGALGGATNSVILMGAILVMNTTSRLEGATRDLERQFLVSGDALERLADLGGFALDDLGLQRLRGRAAPMRVYAVAAKPS